MDEIIKVNEVHGKSHLIEIISILHNILCQMRQIISFSLISVSASRIIDGTTSLREGDIAVSSGRRSKVCFARSCLWSKSVDGHVYVAYRLSPDYCTLFDFSKCNTLQYDTFETRQLCMWWFINCPFLVYSVWTSKWTAEVETKLIKKGMENIEKGTCVRFVPRTHEQDYIDIQPKSGWVPLFVQFDSITWLLSCCLAAILSRNVIQI